MPAITLSDVLGSSFLNNLWPVGQIFVSGDWLKLGQRCVHLVLVLELSRVRNEVFKESVGFLALVYRRVLDGET